ncbi:peptidase U32 family protein [Myroides sp. LJL116]
MIQYNKVELMAPAGNFESLQAALDNGADSIYFGVDQLNMRARASINFTMEDLPEIVKRCKAKNVHSYLTLNTIVYDHDLSVVRNLLQKAKKANISAVIASDQAVIVLAKELGLAVHISTQLNITNIETIKFYSLFADTIVLSRELSLRQIKHITQSIQKQQIKGPSGQLIQIEIFAHGALCMAVSGKCYLSLHSHNSSANRGACKQNCRKKYTVIDQESGFEIEIDNEYMMSPKDLCTIEFLDQIIQSGVQILKIEGRGRSPEYVAKVIQTYKQALQSIEQGTYTKEKITQWLTELSKVYNRGFWSGYYLGQKLGQWSDNPGSNATQKKVYIAKVLHYYTKASIMEFKIEAYDIRKGDTLLITGPTTGAKEILLEELFVDGVPSDTGIRGQNCTVVVPFRVRLSDKVYKIVQEK